MTMSVAERPKTKRSPAEFETARTNQPPESEGWIPFPPTGSSQSREVFLAAGFLSTASTASLALTERMQNFTSVSTVNSNPPYYGNLNPLARPEVHRPQYFLSTGSLIYDAAVFPPAAPHYGASEPLLGGGLIYQAEHRVSDISLKYGLGAIFPNDLDTSKRIELELSRQIEPIFLRGKEERFEDGMESEFARSLAGVIESYNLLALVQIAKKVSEATSNLDVAGEALRLIGRLEDSRTRDVRRVMLELALSNSHPTLRDAASLGLASIDDPRSIPALEKAVSLEQIAELREDMQSVVDQLRSAR